MIVAQLTDLHVCVPGTLAYGRVDTLGYLRRAVDRLNAMRPRIDAVVVSGDLVDHGTSREYAVVRPELDRLAMPWWPVPGNHDGDAFWQVFADRLPGALTHVGCRVEHGGLPIVLLDTRVPDASHGALSDARIDWLDAALAPEPALLVMHHPPFDTGIEHMDRIGLRGRERLLPLLRCHRPLAVLCGHVHRTIHTVLEGVAASIGPSPAHAVAFDLSPGGPSEYLLEPPGVAVHRIAGGTVTSHTVLVDDFPGPWPFFGPVAEVGRT